MLNHSRLTVAACGAALLLTLPAAYAGGGHRGDDHGSGSGFTFTATATAAQEVQVPGVDSDGIGAVVARFDRGLTRVRVTGSLRGLNAPVLAAHFHCGRAGTNGPVAFGILQPGPLTEIGDRFRVTLDATAVAPSAPDCLTSIGRPVNNVASLFGAMEDGLIYVNFHTTFSLGGEVRGQMLDR